MKATELIEKIQALVEKAGDIEVDLNNSNGIFEEIKDVKLAMWTDKTGKLHKVIELIHN